MQSYFQRIRTFETISFVTGFALMAFELVAARLLAPTIGSSVYVWTSVIGVIIAALSIGYAVGGKVADLRVKVSDVAWLLLLAGVSVLSASLLAPSFLGGIVAYFPDARFQGVVAPLILFAPTSFLLGIVSPYLVRLRVSSAKTSGESVGLLSALNSVGGIVGTFLTGFVFFGFLSTVQALIVVASLLVGVSWLVVPREQTYRRIVMMGAFMVIGLLALFPAPREGLVSTIDTATASYQIQEGTLGSDSIRVLVTGPTGYQSGIYTDGRNDLVFFYTKK
ncbi:conserved hypothetical protein [candidate division TM7 genomosp. GTL1]|nr:conserved hypothetical protein [candidate division TM7 genomosp. GTL1]